MLWLWLVGWLSFARHAAAAAAIAVRRCRRRLLSLLSSSTLLLWLWVEYVDMARRFKIVAVSEKKYFRIHFARARWKGNISAYLMGMQPIENGKLGDHGDKQLNRFKFFLCVPAPREERDAKHIYKVNLLRAHIRLALQWAFVVIVRLCSYCMRSVQGIIWNSVMCVTQTNGSGICTQSENAHVCV